MVQNLNMYMSKQDFDTHVIPIISNDSPFSTWLQFHCPSIYEYLTQEQQQVVKKIYKSIPCMKLVYSDGRVVQKNGNDVFAWLAEESAKNPSAQLKLPDRD